MSKLTALKIKSLKEPGNYVDGNGLSLVITKTGTKSWLYRYRLNSNQQKYTIGRYPQVSLSEARKMLIEAKELVAMGLNPSKERKGKKQANIDKVKVVGEWETTFKNIAMNWIARQRNVWSHNHATHVLGSLKKDVFDNIGHMQIDAITPPDVLSVINQVESRGSLEMAKKALQRMSAVFRYAVQNGLCTYNPAGEMKGVLKPRKQNHYPSARDGDLCTLVKDIAKCTHLHPVTKLALQFTNLTACRSGEVRGATWKEINLDIMEWHIPARRMKMEREHWVPLSTQAVAVLERARTLFGKSGLIFPSIRDASKPMSDNAMSKALRDMGYRGKATPHGFRSSFSSMAYEKGFQPEVIEKALAHEEKNKVKSAYNRAEFLEQRRELLQWWGDLIQNMEMG